MVDYIKAILTIVFGVFIGLGLVIIFSDWVGNSDIVVVLCLALGLVIAAIVMSIARMGAEEGSFIDFLADLFR